jgi:predicted aldo/keto reductase-like oxidoreductase
VKGPPANNFNEQLSTSRNRLQTDYIDILYLHSCDTPQMVTYEPMMKALVKAQEAGKARFIGVSTHSNEPDVIRAAVDSDIYDVVLTSYNYMQEHKEEMKKAIAYAAKNGVGIVAMKTMGGNRLNRDENVKINHKAALKWVLNDENVCTTIPGMTTFEQMDLNMSVMGDLELTEDEKRELKISSLLRGTLFCQNCRSCVPSCSRRVEIPNLMRSYMYAVGYGNLIQAETTMAELPANRGLDVCRVCSTCSATCRFGIDIPDRLKSLMNIGYS